MENQSLERSKSSCSDIPYLQDPNSIRESANEDVIRRSHETANAHSTHLKLPSTLGNNSGKRIAEEVELNQIQPADRISDIGLCQYLLQMDRVPSINVNEFAQNSYSINNMPINYHLPLSTLIPNKFHGPTSSRFARQHLHPLASMPVGGLGDLSKMDTKTNQAHWSSFIHEHAISTPTRSLMIQDDHPHLSGTSSGFNLDTGSSSFHYPPRSGLKRKENWPDDNAPPISRSEFLKTMNNQGQGQGGDRFSLYDPRYKAIGMHVDPHLRMFAKITEGKNKFVKLTEGKNEINRNGNK